VNTTIEMLEFLRRLFFAQPDVVFCSRIRAGVSPISLFVMGVWMQNQGKALFRIPWQAAVLSMLSKLVIVPLVMVGLAKAMGLNDEAGRAAVLIAGLPISMASFSLGSHYNIGEALLAENVALGTALMLPTVLIWNLVMDALPLFPISKGEGL
jgi:predicted permease